MTHLLIKILAQAELRELYESTAVQQYLQENSQRHSTAFPFEYVWKSNDDPTLDLAIVWIFPGEDVVCVDQVIYEDVMYLPRVTGL
jgi:hypothetical protein